MDIETLTELLREAEEHPACRAGHRPRRRPRRRGTWKRRGCRPNRGPDERPWWRGPGCSTGSTFPPASVEPDDVAALALHLMTNTALTGATYDVDGGQQLLAPS